MNKQILNDKLRAWVAEKEQNGVRQHSRKWLAAKAHTIGGSSLATIQGRDPYRNIYKLIAEKIGFSKFESNAAPQWGNLFEDVIKRYVEHDKKCEVLGEDLYILGKDAGTSYSPDGLAVMDTINEYMFEEETMVDTPNGPAKSIELVVMSVPKTTIVLCEFKCPYSRIPSGSAPDNYIPQVKMGLELLEIATVGLLIEGVFRRCTWDQVGNNPDYDRTLVPRSSGKLPLAYGIIGFYYDADEYKKQVNRIPALANTKASLIKNYIDHYVELGDPTNSFQCNDLGEAPPDLFKLVLAAADSKILSVWYGDIVYANDSTECTDSKDSNYIDGSLALNSDLDKFTLHCAANGFLNFGILPWKLFRVDYNYIQKEDNYLAPWLPKIREVLDVVQRCNDSANAEIKANLYSSYINNTMNKGFSDF